MILFHGSENILKKPLYGGGKKYNDYGQGFYCTREVELAKEWACTEGLSAYVNQYEIALENLKVLDLTDERYSILHWLSILMEHRRVRVTSPIMKSGMEWLLQNYRVDVSEYDVIVGYRADDSYFSFARAFLNNQITLGQLSRAMELGELGLQYVICSKKAFDELVYLGYEVVDKSIYYAKRVHRDEQARASYTEELMIELASGVYIRDLMKEERR